MIATILTITILACIATASISINIFLKLRLNAANENIIALNIKMNNNEDLFDTKIGELEALIAAHESDKQEAERLTIEEFNQLNATITGLYEVNLKAREHFMYALQQMRICDALQIFEKDDQVGLAFHGIKQALETLALAGYVNESNEEQDNGNG